MVRVVSHLQDPSSLPLPPHVLWSSLTNSVPATLASPASLGLARQAPASGLCTSCFLQHSSPDVPPLLLQVFTELSVSLWGLPWPPWLKLQPPLSPHLFISTELTPCLYTRYHIYLFSLLSAFPPLNCKCQEDRDLCLFQSLLHSQCQPCSSLPISLCLIHGWCPIKNGCKGLDGGGDVNSSDSNR